MSKIRFSNPKVTEHVVDEIKETPKPLPRSSSTTGLASLSKGLIEQSENIENLNDMIQHLKEIISKYENEIKVIVENSNAQSKIIDEQNSELIKTKSELEVIHSEVNSALDEIQKIWET